MNNNIIFSHIRKLGKLLVFEEQETLSWLATGQAEA